MRLVGGEREMGCGVGGWGDSNSEMREWENDHRKYFMINFHERMLPTRRGSNPQPPDHQSAEHPTEPPRPVSPHGQIRQRVGAG